MTSQSCTLFISLIDIVQLKKTYIEQTKSKLCWHHRVFWLEYVRCRETI